jgi:hypothetical protein
LSSRLLSKNMKVRIYKTIILPVDDNLYISNALDTIRENITISSKRCLDCSKWKQHKPWFDEGGSTIISKLISQIKMVT